MRKTILSGLAIETGTYEGQTVFPEDLTLVGLDPGTTRGDFGWDPRVLRPYTPATVQTICQYGVLQPALVTKDGDQLIVRDGRGRVINARQANIELVAKGQERKKMKILIVPKGTTQAEIDAMSMTTNVHREEETGIQLAEKLHAFLVTHGDGEESWELVLPALNLDRARADELLTLRAASPELKRQLNEKKFGVEASLAFARLPLAEQKEAIFEAQAIAAASGQAKVSADLARQIVGRRQGQEVGQSKSMLRMIHKHVEVHGWPAHPHTASFIAWQLGKAKVDDVPGLAEIIKAATRAEAKEQNRKKEPPGGKTSAKKHKAKK